MVVFHFIHYFVFFFDHAFASESLLLFSFLIYPLLVSCSFNLFHFSVDLLPFCISLFLFICLHVLLIFSTSQLICHVLFVFVCSFVIVLKNGSLDNAYLEF